MFKYGVDPDGNKVLVRDVVFELRAAEDIHDANGNDAFYENDLIDTAFTNADGRAKFTTKLSVGRYMIKEVDAPAGYYSSDNVAYFDTEAYEANDHVQVIRFQGDVVNPVTCTVITLQDWVTDVHLKDTSFQIVDEDGHVVTDAYGNEVKWITDGGEHIVDGLDPEKAYIVEEVRPSTEYSYIIRDEDGNAIHNVTDDQGKEVVNEYQFTIPDMAVHEDILDGDDGYHNERQEVDITILKHDAEDRVPVNS